MHPRLKELDRRGNADQRHRDYRIRIHFSTTSRRSLQSGDSTIQQSLAAYSRQVKGHGGRVRNWKSGPIDPRISGRWFTRMMLQGDLAANRHE
jgi:hypothetical protein